MALRMPISRMREVTVASMMFMMPMPLTSRVTMEIRSRTQVRPVAMRSAMESSAVRLATSYTDSERCRDCSTRLICAVAEITIEGSSMEKYRSLTLGVSMKYRLTE